MTQTQSRPEESDLGEDMDRKENTSNLVGGKCVYEAATSKRIYYPFV